MAHDVFISHSAKDKEVADAVCHRLEEVGIRCWIAPRDVQAGQAWDDAIVDALAATKIVVLVFSAAANESRAVRNEIASALDGNKIVFPFRIENIVPSGGMQFHLSRVHWLDAMTPPLDGHIDTLIANAQRQLGLEAAERPSPPPTPRPQPQPGPRASPAAAPPRSGATWVLGAVAGAALLVAIGVGGYVAMQRPAPTPPVPPPAAPNPPASSPGGPATNSPFAPIPAPAPIAPAPTAPPPVALPPVAPPPAAPAPTPPPAAPTAAPTAAPAPPSGEFIFPNSDHQAVDPGAAAALGCAQLSIARNEIYARHGHIFLRADLRAYFTGLSWYRPTSPETQLSPFESENVGVITRAEAQKGCR